MIRPSLIGIVVFSVFWGAGSAIPQAPQGAGAPFVKSVSFYKDWKLTKTIDTVVEPGTTIYTKIVFSEPMKLKVADDNTARPVLYYRFGSKRIRYRIARHGAGGADFVSGDAKPLQRGTDDYICKYTLPEGTTGKFTTMIGKLSADLNGNTMENFYTHPDRLTISSEDVTPAVSTGRRAPNLPQPTDTPVDQLTGTPLDTKTLIELLDTTDIIPVVDTAPGEKPRDEAFIFRKFLEQLLADLKALNLLADYDVETIFQTPGKGFIDPSRGIFGTHYSSRPMNFRLLGIFVPDAITTTSVSQVNRFSAKYKLTRDELITLLRNLRLASILVINVKFHPVQMPDQNLRKAVVAEINKRGISLGPINRLKKPTDIIYVGEMWEIEGLRAEAAGIESLIGLEYAKNLKSLYLGNLLYQDWTDIQIGAKTPNKISDLTPLENLTNLGKLDLTCNAVWSLRPLRNLTKLTDLRLAENKITNIAPLADLTNLGYLDIHNYYYSPPWAGNNRIEDLSPIRNLKKLYRLDVGQNPIGGSIGVVRDLPKLQGLNIGCCGVSNLRPLVECPGLRGEGSWVYLVYSPLRGDDPDLEVLRARGVSVEDGLLWRYNNKGEKIEFLGNEVEKCSVSYRESLRAAPALQMLIEPEVLSSLWHDLSQVPEETLLLPNYPNPFNPETWIPYQLATPAEVTVAIHAADGQFVRTLSLGYQAAGVYQSKGRAVYWDGRNALGEPVASGVYFYTLMAGDFTATRKLLIRK